MTEPQYLAFQIFTYFSPDPAVASLLSSGSREPLLPGTAALRAYVEDIKKRIGTVGTPQHRLAVILGPLCFEQTDTDTAQFIARAFDLAQQTNVAVGFHLDDSIFWARRKDLWSDPRNVEARDWEGTPCTGRRLDWGRKPSAAPPQMCFNSKAIQQEVQQRAALIGKAIRAGVASLPSPELFAGVIAGWETMIGQDFKTGTHLGYRALRNRGFTRALPPPDIDAERESIVQEFIGLWTKSLAAAGVSPQKIYSHTAFHPRRLFTPSEHPDTTYSQINHFAPPSVAFGELHRPGFSTYPQPGLFDEIHEAVAKHKQVGWASSEGTNMEPSSGPGQTGMTMETYLAKLVNHGATLVNIFAWGVGGEAMKTMDFRVVTEGEEALLAYRKFLRGERLVEGTTLPSLVERLPAKIHRIQRELPGWVQKTGRQAEVQPLMRQLDAALKANKLPDAEALADTILKLLGTT